MIAVALKGLAGRKVRALLTALAIVIGVSMVAGTFILTDSTQQSGLALADDSPMTTDAVIFQKEYVKGSATGSDATMPEALLGKVRELPTVAIATGDVLPLGQNNVADIIGRDGRPAATMSIGRGFDPAALKVSPVNGTAYGPLDLASGHWPKGREQVVIDRHTAAVQRFELGDRITVATRGHKHTFELAGTVSYIGETMPPRPSFAGWDIDTAQWLLGRAGRFDAISIQARPGTSTAALARSITPLLPADLQLKGTKAAVDEAKGDWAHTISRIRSFLLVFGGIALLVGAFVIFNTLSITVAQRTRELATLRTLGASRRQVMRSVVIEGLVLGVVASAIGLAAGYGLARGMVALVEAFGFFIPKGHTVIAPRTVAVSMGLGVVVTLVASLVPARRATRVPPIAAVREGALLSPNRLGWLVAPLVRVVGWPSRRTGAAGQLAAANTVRNPGRTASTAAALMIGLTLVTAVAVLGAGLNSATRSAITDQVDADYVVDSRDVLPFAAAGGDQLAAVPGVRAASHVRSETVLVQGAKSELSGIDPATIGRFYHFAWATGSARTLAGLDADGAIVTQRFATKHAAKAGGHLAVTTPAGKHATLVVRGIYDPPAAAPLLGDVSISRRTFDGAFRKPGNSLTFLDADAHAAAALKSTAAGLTDLRLHTAPAYVTAKTQEMRTMLAILYVLLALSIVVSLFGMVNTLVLSVFERTRELGMLRTLGMTRRQARRMIRHESVITAMIGTTLGVGLGLVAAVSLIVALPALTVISIPWLTLVAFTVVAVLAGIGAAVLPARRAARLNVLEAIQYE
jgi:putative ABC transport system permease protein